jgi:hypothetical protein
VGDIPEHFITGATAEARTDLPRIAERHGAKKPAVAPVIKWDELNRSADRAPKNVIQRLRYGVSIDMAVLPR